MKGVLIISLLLFLLPLFASSSVKQQVYIVYFGQHSGEKAFEEIEEAHHSYLLTVKETVEEARASLVYSYKNSINGFAAKLTPDESSKLSEMEEVVSVIPSRPGEYVPHTTRSWVFAGLLGGEGGEDMLVRARYGSEVIVGVMDSGIWPESQSFSDEGMEPIPTSWKGICQAGDEFNSSHCNRKLIGARFYLKGYEAYYGSLNRSIDYLSPRDRDGHGTHTASTVGGRGVPNASAMGGFAMGTATGGASLARIAIYKACWAIPGESKDEGNTCFTEDMLAAMDDAIGDGVHILSVSIGGSRPLRFAEDAIAIGSLHAVKHNIVVSCSAGNSGPGPATLSNTWPWIITVGASSIDRTFPSPVVLGNSITIPGQTVTSHKLTEMEYPLAYAADIVSEDVPKSYIAGQCLPGSLSPEKTKGKIVLCLRGNGTRAGKGMEAKRAGAAGFILGNNPINADEITVDAHVLPATAVVYEDSIKILAYINSTENATATIVPAKTLLHTKPAPLMAVFSSRGPNVLDPQILKPDITAPGLNILAAWSEGDSPIKLEDDHSIVKYNIFSGTSMSCPHVASAAALLRAIQPNWSSAAIRSALMTTASIQNNVGLPITDPSGNLADPFQYGAGHFQPTVAADPGLVYDASYTDYLLYLCGLGINKVDLSFECPIESSASNNLNYPSLAIPKLNHMVIVNRTVTNVGCTNCLYFSLVVPPPGYAVEISPSTLFFSYVGQRRSFTIKVKANDTSSSNKKEGEEYSFGWYTWSDGIHIVRSPMAVSLA